MDTKKRKLEHPPAKSNLLFPKSKVYERTRENKEEDSNPPIIKQERTCYDHLAGKTSVACNG